MSQEIAIRDAHIFEASQADETDSLRQQLRALRAEAAQLRADLNAERQRSQHAFRALAALRKQLTPLHRALQAVFGELDTVDIDDVSPASAPSQTKHSAIWEAWKSRVGEGAAKVIDALLLHGQMNTQQLAIATGYHRTTIPSFIYKLNKAGLLNKQGGQFSLKQL